jgi:hypothetical protein
MLVQLLVQNGMSARLVPFTEVSDDGIMALDTSGVSIVCICHLEISGNRTGLRRLVRRLRPRLQEGTPVIAGLWAANDPVLTDEAIQVEIGADRFGRSLGEIVALCAHSRQ